MEAEYKVKCQWVSEEVAFKDFQKRVERDLAIYGVAYIEDLGGGLKRVIDPKYIQVRKLSKPLHWYKRFANFIKKLIRI